MDHIVKKSEKKGISRGEGRRRLQAEVRGKLCLLLRSPEKRLSLAQPQALRSFTPPTQQQSRLGSRQDRESRASSSEAESSCPRGLPGLPETGQDYGRVGRGRALGG